jgi:hypothetical protein
VHEGDVRHQHWQTPISVLFVDITKSWATADAVRRTALPSLLPGALVIQQDLVHWGQSVVCRCHGAPLRAFRVAGVGA